MSLLDEPGRCAETGRRFGSHESPVSSTFNAVLTQAVRTLTPYCESPRLEAELLLEHATGVARARLRIDAHRELTEGELQCFGAFVRRRVQGEPVAYILGESGFWTFDLKVNPVVLIPRPETELLVERALNHLPTHSPSRVLDLGTGSGAIALALAKERPMAAVIATDASPAALAVAGENAARLNLPVKFIESDWYAHLHRSRFDCIVSNPPYIAAGDPDLDPAVFRTEPSTALIAGPTGLEALQRIIVDAPKFLTPDGWLALEHGWRQGAAVRELLVAAGFHGVASHADLAGNERVTEGQWREPALT